MAIFTLRQALDGQAITIGDLTLTNLYLANYGDLQAVFGSNTEAATQHYIQFGLLEGRNDFIV